MCACAAVAADGGREVHARRQLLETGAPRVLGDIEERELWRDVIDSSAAGGDILEPAGAARAARRARRALHEYGIPLPAVAEQGAESQEALTFLDWDRTFEARCRALDCVSADRLLGMTPPPAAYILLRA